MADTATIAYVHANELAASFHESFVDLVMGDMAGPQHLAHRAGRIAVRCGTDGLVAARNMVAKAFLDSGADWLFVVDTDMGFAPDTLHRLIEAAHPKERPVVGALCFASREMERDGMGGFRTVPMPTIYDWRPDDGLFVARSWYPVNQLTRCGATGSACLILHRDALQAVADEYGTWYDRLPGPKGPLGEDISLCARLGAVGVPIHVHTGVRTTHLKPQWVAEPDYFARYLPDPADEPIAVVVPVYRRTGNVERFMRSLRASTGLATVVAVCDADEDPAVRSLWLTHGAKVVDADAETFAAKVNAGYRASAEPWLLFVGDDVRFHPGWWDHALLAARRTGAKVIATNDLANPRVLEGDHANHPVIARDYIDQRGASWDGPGTVAHPGYRHWFVDNEWTLAAQDRGVFAAAPGAVVEHVHPIAGKADMDDVYQIGYDHAKEDEALFLQRVRKHHRVASW